MTEIVPFVGKVDHKRDRIEPASVKNYYYSIKIKYFGGDNNIIPTFTINTNH